MAGARGLLGLWLGCFCVSLARGETPERRLPELHGAAPAERPAGGGASPELPPHDQVSEHMLRLYDRYRGGGGVSAPRTPGSRERGSRPRRPQHARKGNTVRSFRAGAAGTLEGKGLHIFNMTSLTKSENILSATLYFNIGELVNISLSCPVSQGCAHHVQGKHIQLDLSAWILNSTPNQSQLLGHLSVDVARPHGDVASWLSKDITQLLRKAKENDDFLIGFNITSRAHQLPKRMLPFLEPYILVYANDAAISEPESVVSSFQAHRNFPTGAVPKLDSHIRAALSIERRKKRSTGVLLPLQNNELPGAEYQYKEDGVWEERKPYKSLQTQPTEKSKNKKKQRKGPHQKSQTLQFDEQTLKKARRKQWIEPRNCARRYLKVDFADIGWSEWIISPKSFDAYYCSGACQFPMPKSLKPSNHATIQSIVRAVGVIPGIPEPCCVPEKMSSLSILFFDENKNVVLKVYPNMTVESCACR
ncbi:Bone morphogenetic protein 3 [Heterocephalus glaber]|uniref:Bone morphogenetic protein 3 n=1 Tax=Heterocephalus glaber TaxID=10181 RepID=G5AME7_HETGA|nr:bone morphogenetic protein 3 [Heterocephalus glaber]EHA98207.1 Bone morphogenetic protein 3 [Heterocephalus glaber]